MGDEDPADLEERHTVHLTPAVLVGEAQQRGRQQRPQQRLPLLDGVPQPQRVAPWIGGIEAQGGEVLLAQEGEAHRLDEPLGREQVLRAIGEVPGRGPLRRPQLADRQRHRDALVAVDARDLLHQVLGQVQVVAVRGDARDQRGVAIACRRDTHPFEQSRSLLRRDLRSEQAVRAGDVQPDRLGARRVLTASLDDPGRHLAPGELGDEPCGPIRCAGDAVAVHAALEAVGGLAVQAVPTRAAPHGGRVEVRALDQHVAGRVADLAVVAAHHPRDRDRPLVVGDDEIARIEGAILAIQGDDVLTLAGAAHHDARSPQLRQVEGVQRLPELEQHQVRRVDDAVDRSHAGGLEALL